MSELFSYHAERAGQARLHRLLGSGLRYAIVTGSLLCSGCAVWLFLTHSALGWVFAGVAVGLLTPLVWDERYLKRLPVGVGNRFEDRLEADLLATLPFQIQRVELVQAMARVRSVQFMMVRTGVSPAAIADSFSDTELQLAWQEALARKPQGLIRGSDVLVGLVARDPSLKMLLPHLQLDLRDIELAADWYDHLDQLIAYHAARHTGGGIARDWSFGYSHLLERFGENMSARVAANGTLAVDIEAHQGAIDFLLSSLGEKAGASVALVGPGGSGKTTVVEAFAEKLMLDEGGVPEALQFRQVIRLDAAALISAAADRGQLEQVVNGLLVEAYRAKNIILFFDDAELFFEEGVGSVDLTNLLKPVLENSTLKVIFTMDEQRFLKISERNSALATGLTRYVITPASYEETMRVMQDQLIPIEFQKRVTYMYQALREAFRLSERYLHDVAQPGKSLKLLASASQYADNGLVTAVSVRTAIEKEHGVKVGANASGEEKEKLLQLESLIHKRMINQKRAVQVVSDALRRARAGVRSESRPIGTFLFLGPTGVGKTELAKALADVYFDGEDHLLRLDMNEFVSPDDVKRLIADGASDPHSLSAQVMKQPFAVVLLDEIEKAHDSVLATLLQVLDEGVLRDIKGREVSFRDAIIIATSNAGAEAIRHHIEAGEELDQFEQAFEDELIRSGQFRPEFLNRFDEVVLFRPLNQVELAQVVTLIIDGINKTLETQKIRVAIDTKLKAWLVVKGNDPRLGARPMRRMVQRVVENVIAKRLLAGEVQPGETVTLSLDDVPEELQ